MELQDGLKIIDLLYLITEKYNNLDIDPELLVLFHMDNNAIVEEVPKDRIVNGLTPLADL